MVTIPILAHIVSVGILVSLRRPTCIQALSARMIHRVPPSQEKIATRSIAIIGGGIAGLSCAQHLLELAPNDPSTRNGRPLAVTVFDTGRLRPGGRASSRQPGDPPKESSDAAFPILSRYRCDHVAQVIQVQPSPTNDDRFDAFDDQVRHWVEQGVLQPFGPGTLLRLSFANDQLDLQPTLGPASTPQYYYAPDGMGTLASKVVERCRTLSTDMASFELRQDVWVSPSNGAQYIPQKRQWKLKAQGRVLGHFDELVIAHNGKCADRLMSRSPATDVHALLRVNFAATVQPVAKRMTLNSIYSWTFVLPRQGSVLRQRLGERFVCGYVESSPDLRFITCQTNKLSQVETDDDDPYEVWTVLSSPAFAKKHKAPQEALGVDTIETVTGLLSQALNQYLLLPGPLRIVEQRLQLWGAALPLNVWNNGLGYVHDGELHVGICGDWLVEASIRGAWTSGRFLAMHLLSLGGEDDPDRPLPKVGLDGAFDRSVAATKAGIGALQLQGRNIESVIQR